MSIVAKFPGTCTSCAKPIVPGQTIEWRKGAGSHHLDCSSTASSVVPSSSASVKTAAPASDGSIKLYGGSGYGCDGWTIGQVLTSSEQRRRDGGPDGLVILTASRRYVREDGLSFGVGDDSGYLYSATARPATAAELAPAIEVAHIEALAIERSALRKLLVVWFRDVGEYPSGSHTLTGEEIKLGGGERIYGGGLWAVIEPAGELIVPSDVDLASARAAHPRSIWLCQNNGHDGDDWSKNNVRTGGAGAIGCAVPWTVEIEARIRALAE